MVSNNDPVAHSSDVLRNQDHNSSDVSEIPEAQTKPMTELGTTSTCPNETISIPSNLSDTSVGQPDVSINDCVKARQVKKLPLCSKQDIKEEQEEVKDAENATVETESLENGGDIRDHLKMLVDHITKPTTEEEMSSDRGDFPPDISAQRQQQQENLVPTVALEQAVALLPATMIQLSPVFLLQPMQPRYLRREEYLAAVMVCTLADFTNTLNPVIQDAFTHGKYEHLLGYATALDNAGQISTALEVIILATAKCFRPLGMVREIDPNFELTANILKHCHNFARGELLHLLKMMLERAPAAFTPRGEAFIPILDGFAAVLESYAEVVGLAAEARMEGSDNKGVLERWRLEQENASRTMGILQWVARQPAHWACLNGSQMLLIALSDVATETSVDQGIHRMVIDYMALNNEFLPSLDAYIPQNLVLDNVISTFEHSTQRVITSLQYPDYMTAVAAEDGDTMAFATMTVLSHYSPLVPGSSPALARLVDTLVDVLVGDISLRIMVCATVARLFDRFYDEFEVDRKFVETIGELMNDERCKESAIAILRTIQQRWIVQEQSDVES